MAHRIIIGRAAAHTDQPSGIYTNSEYATYHFEYGPAHDETPEQAADKFARILKHLKKAEAIANGHDHD